MMDERFTELIDEASAGLRDDEELRLEVRAELATHLERTAEELHAEGYSPEESVTEAVKQFGSPLEMAAELLAANNARLSRRALTRLAVRALFVPFALLIAGWLGYGSLVNLQQLGISVRTYLQNFALPPSTTLDLLWSAARHPLPALPGQVTVDTLWQRIPPDYNYRRLPSLRQLQQAHPNDPVLFAYLSSSPQTHPTAELVRQGEARDPGNALYRYRFAAELAQQAEDDDTLEVLLDGDTRKNTVQQKRMLLDRAMAELRLGLDKPFLSSYLPEIMHRRTMQLPPPTTQSEFYAHTQMVGWDVYPILSSYRMLSRISPQYAQLLIREGRKDEARVYLEGWHRLPQQMLARPVHPLELQVAIGCAKRWGEQSAQVYASTGDSAAAQRTREHVQRLTTPMLTWSNASTLAVPSIKRYGNPIATPFLILRTSLGQVPIGDRASLAPLRRLGYLLFEEIALNALLLFLAAYLLSLIIRQFLLLRRARHAGAVPLLLLPGWRDTVRLAVVSVGIPLLGYAVYAASPIAGRQVSVEYQFPRCIAEIILLGTALYLLPRLLTMRRIQARCRHLRVPVPSTRREQQLPQYRLYRGTVTRSLIPVYALALLLIAGIGTPYLHLQAQRAYRQDRMFLLHPGEIIPQQEAAIIEPLRQQLFEIVTQINREDGNYTAKAHEIFRNLRMANP